MVKVMKHIPPILWYVHVHLLCLLAHYYHISHLGICWIPKHHKASAVFQAPEPDPQLHVFVSAFPVVNWQVVMDHRPDHDTNDHFFGFNFHNLPKMQSPETSTEKCQFQLIQHREAVNPDKNLGYFCCSHHMSCLAYAAGDNS